MSVSHGGRVQLIESPRDAMQGWKTFIPTAKKILYLNSLLKVGFHTLDCGSFVSPKAIPQLADTKEVVKRLSLQGSKTRLLVIVANLRGAGEAASFEQISYLGFPFSISPTFQRRNTNSTIEESEKSLEQIQNLCVKTKKELVVYLSMAFGNRYGDPYEEETLLDWADEMVKKDIKIISLADTIGIATPDQINFALNTLITAFPQCTFGIHLHASEVNWQNKLAAAVEAGCKRFDGAVKGIGGCPMAEDELIGNMNTEWMLDYFKGLRLLPAIDEDALSEALLLADEIFI